MNCQGWFYVSCQLPTTEHYYLSHLNINAALSNLSNLRLNLGCVFLSRVVTKTPQSSNPRSTKCSFIAHPWSQKKEISYVLQECFLNLLLRSHHASPAVSPQHAVAARLLQQAQVSELWCVSERTCSFYIFQPGACNFLHLQVRRRRREPDLFLLYIICSFIFDASMQPALSE